MAIHWWPLPILIIVVTGAAIAGTHFAKTGVFAPKGSSSSSSSNNPNQPDAPPDSDAIANKNCDLRGTYYDEKAKKCAVCPEPKKTFSVFWQSQTDGCMDFKKSEAFQYVTHMYWGFALIDPSTGAVIPKFQGNDNTLKTCMQSMRNKCVRQFVSIGGATMRESFVALNTTAKIANFGKTAGEIVSKFGFDGIDIDDESGNLLAGGDWKKNAGANVVGYLKSTKAALQSLPIKTNEPAYSLTWDEFPSSLNEDCNSPGGDYQRCFPSEIGGVVDQVNIMIYNSASRADYDKYLKTTIPTVWTKSIAADKIVLGGCVGKAGDEGACSYGESPSNAQLATFASEGASKYGGTMLWTGSADILLNKGQSMITMGKAGSYGVGV